MGKHHLDKQKTEPMVSVKFCYELASMIMQDKQRLSDKVQELELKIKALEKQIK